MQNANHKNSNQLQSLLPQHADPIDISTIPMLAPALFILQTIHRFQQLPGRLGIPSNTLRLHSLNQSQRLSSLMRGENIARHEKREDGEAELMMARGNDVEDESQNLGG